VEEGCVHPEQMHGNFGFAPLLREEEVVSSADEEEEAVLVKGNPSPNLRLDHSFHSAL
jgi:hypothetical protein